MIGRRFAHYEILSKLGDGGMGVVYKARDTHLDRFVAIKVLPPEFVADPERTRRFTQEAKAASALNHPGIITIYDITQAEGTDFIAMEYVQGKTLGELIGRRGLRLKDTLSYAAQAASALAKAHAAGIVHRDLKPSNIMVTDDGLVKILDFGVAKLTTADAGDSEAAQDAPTRTIPVKDQPHTEAGKIIGTVAYMSPEQAEGKSVDARSDIFSFGAVLYEIVTGTAAFHGKSSVQTLAAVVNEDPHAPSQLVTDLPRELERIILRCLRKDPERRFQTASDLRVALEDLREEVASGAHPRELPNPVRRPLRWWGWAGAAVIIMVVAGLVVWLRLPRSLSPFPLRQQTFEAGMALMPALSPDGQLLAYVSDHAGNGALDLWVEQVAGGEAVRLVSGMGTLSNPQFSPNGTLIYFLGPQDDIFEVSTLGGVARKLIDSAGPFSVSSRGEIAFVRLKTGGAPNSIQIVQPDGGSLERWKPDCVATMPPAWSPDGQRLAFVGACPSGVGLLIAPRYGGSAQRIPIADSPAALFAPRGFVPWSHMAWFRTANGSEGLVAPWRQGDTVNLYQFSLDGARSPITLGTGWETSPSLSTTGQIVFTRAEITTTIWSLGLEARPPESTHPRKEVAPAGLFGVSRDGNRLVFGRILGPERGELRSRNVATGIETALATHDITLGGVGSFWAQVSPDDHQVVYRVLGPKPGTYVVSTAGGAPRLVQAINKFNLASDWQESNLVIGECQPTAAGVCGLDPISGDVKTILKDPHGELLYPSWSWDGQWLTFMRRQGGRTTIWVSRRSGTSGFASEADWVEITDAGLSGLRPRFAPDGKSLFYLLSDKGVLTLVHQALDPGTKRPRGPVERLVPVQVFPTVLGYSIGASNSTIDVSRDRVFFNTTEVRSNVWRTSIK